jgi:UDP-2-acetamido-3-amino-2,3-dideoxy-glucuronate N-acetyltransferase
MEEKKGFYAHPTAEVSPRAVIGTGTRIWNFVQVREGAHIGENCIVGKDAYVDFDVQIGNNVKIQNGALIYHGASLEDGVFIGPQAVLTNDLYPRAIAPDGSLKGNDDWEVGPIRIGYGASIGACSVVRPNVTIGRFALVGAGAVVVHDVPDHGLVVGVPARLIGYVCACGQRLEKNETGSWVCAACGQETKIKES